MSKKTIEELEDELLRSSKESQRSQSSSRKVLRANRPNFLSWLWRAPAILR